MANNSLLLYSKNLNGKKDGLFDLSHLRKLVYMFEDTDKQIGKLKTKMNKVESNEFISSQTLLKTMKNVSKKNRLPSQSDAKDQHIKPILKKKLALPRKNDSLIQFRAEKEKNNKKSVLEDTGKFKNICILKHS
jgi:hypothetical protein